MSGIAPRTVLIVDDSPDFCDSLAMLLRLEGYDPAVATNGREALDYLRTHAPPSIIVLDLRMPLMDGYAFSVEQRLDPALADIPVVVCSGEVAPEEREELGHAAFCPKGADPVEMLRLIHDCCRE